MTGRSHRGSKERPDAQHRLALCAEAQSDGVPCTDRGRRCEICEKAFPLAKDKRDRVPTRPGEDGPLPISGA